jgi:hypothetical protein
LARWLTEYLAHPVFGLSCVLLMHQAAVLDSSAFGALTLQQHGLHLAEIDISWAQIATVRLIALAFTGAAYSAA